MANRPRISINTDLSEGLCFGCGGNNPFGLKLNFEWDGKTAKTEFTPTKFYQGWPGILHGGIIATMLDEAMSYAVRFSGWDFLTAKIQVEFKRPVLIDERLIITSSIIRKTGRFIKAEASVYLPDGTLMAEGTGTYVVNEALSDDAGEKEKSQSNA